MESGAFHANALFEFEKTNKSREALQKELNSVDDAEVPRPEMIPKDSDSDEKLRLKV